MEVPPPQDVDAVLQQRGRPPAAHEPARRSHNATRPLLQKEGYVQKYRAEKKSLQILLSRTQTGPGRKVKQEREEISRNHVPRLFSAL